MNNLANAISEYVSDVAPVWNQKQTPTRDLTPRSASCIRRIVTRMLLEKDWSKLNLQPNVCP